jgi:hypothetical protein
MLYLLWSVFNLVVLAGFIYAWFKVLQLLRTTKSTLLAVLFLLGSCGYMGSGVNSESKLEPAVLMWKTPFTSVFQTIHEKPSLALKLHGAYARDSSGVLQARVSSTLSGFVTGFTWVPGPVRLVEKNGRIHYWASGQLEWHLLRTRLFTQYLTYEGTVVSR